MPPSSMSKASISKMKESFKLTAKYFEAEFRGHVKNFKLTDVLQVFNRVLSKSQIVPKILVGRGYGVCCGVQETGTNLVGDGKMCVAVQVQPKGEGFKNGDIVHVSGVGDLMVVAVDGMVDYEACSRNQTHLDAVYSPIQNTHYDPLTSSPTPIPPEVEEQLKPVEEESSNALGQVYSDYQHFRKDEVVGEGKFDNQDEIDIPPSYPVRNYLWDFRIAPAIHTAKWDTQADNVPEYYQWLVDYQNRCNVYKNEVKQSRGNAYNARELTLIGKTDVCIRLLQAPHTYRVISTLFPSECYKSVVHCRLTVQTRNVLINMKERECKNPTEVYGLMSGTRFQVQAGLRRYVDNAALVIFSDGSKDVSDQMSVQKSKCVVSRQVTNGQLVNAHFVYFAVPHDSEIELYSVESGVLHIRSEPVAEDQMTIKEFRPADAKGLVKLVDPNIILLERAILCGYPHKINGKRVTVKYMFSNAHDVEYFKPAPLHSTTGKQGKIRAALGIHGLFKAEFNEPIKQHENVYMALYRRVFC